MKHFGEWLLCLMIVLMLPTLALAADDTITVPYVDYSSFDYFDYGEASIWESEAFTQWIYDRIPAEITGEYNQMDWLDENAKLSYTANELVTYERFWFSAPYSPAVWYDVAAGINENSHLAITVEVGGESFTVEWVFEDTGLRAKKPKITGAIAVDQERGVLYARNNAELTFEFGDCFSSDSPFGAEGYHEAVFHNWDGQKEILSSGAGSTVLKWKCPDGEDSYDYAGTITYTYGALDEEEPGTEGNRNWAIKTEYSYFIEIMAPETAIADESNEIYYVPGFRDLFEEQGVEKFDYDEPLQLGETTYETIWPWLAEHAPIRETGAIDDAWCNENLDVKWEYENIFNPQPFGFSIGELPSFGFDMSRVSENSWIRCIISMKNDPSDKLVLERRFIDSGLVPVEPTITGARNIVKTGAHRYEVHVQEGDVLNVKLNDYFRPEMTKAPRRYYWFTLSNYDHEEWWHTKRESAEIRNNGYRKQLNAGWGIGSQSLEITSEHDGLHLLGYYGGSAGDPPRITRGGWEGWGYKDETYDYAAVCYTIDIVVDREVPQTGDDSHLLLWSTCALLSLMGAAGSVKRKKA